MSDSYDDYEAKIQLAEQAWEKRVVVKTEHDKQIEIAQAYERGWNAATVELCRLHQVNQDLLEILKQFSECDLNENNCATLDVATKRIRSMAFAAIAKATGEKHEP